MHRRIAANTKMRSNVEYPQDKIKVRNLNGEEALETVVVEREEDMSSYQLAVLIITAKKVQLPIRCAKLVWDAGDVNRLASNQKSNLNGNIIWRAMGEVGYDPDMWLCEQVCFICESECADADDTNSRHTNCVRCFPCFLCGKCRIYMPKQAIGQWALDQLRYYPEVGAEFYTKSEWPVCFECLEEEDMEVLKNIAMTAEQRFRLKILNNEIAMLM